MHSILLPNNKVVMYDATIWQISRIKLPTGSSCRIVNEKTGEKDCWAHSIFFDIETGELTPLQLHTDTWCSSGALDVNGNLVGTGGDKTGSRTVRYLQACDTCNWKEDRDALNEARWYATTVTLGDGSFVIFGGRATFSYEYIPAQGKYNKESTKFPFIYQTKDPVENNLYPFVHLSTDGNLFIFANNRSILFNPKSNKILREYPVLSGGSRNYPSSGMSVLIPIRLYADDNRNVIPAEVLVCGGSTHDSYSMAETKKVYVNALADCGRMRITRDQAVWKKEKMPSPRVMGDMLLLPTGDVLMLNGAKKGSSGWGYAKEPNLTPVLYKPTAKMFERFQELAPTKIPRMYHASSALLPDGKVLVAGSNTNNGYLTDVEFPTELRVEKFSPPYLNPALDDTKPEIIVKSTNTKLSYGKKFSVQIRAKGSFKVNREDIMVTMYAPAFTTHGISMNQRLLILGVHEVRSVWPGVHNILSVAPPSGNIAPQGYYLLFVVYRGVPSKAVWVQIK
ncbi:Glyoxal_oxid_N domain-containing protein/DUF1929 domain-containing protein [Cephalotus follicularis]|uniref:Glyoxal_oxid_N domain-containing protein/DUF1929 domain-containing protein n=1 Tax=Cephalotus follicularis TaxID=3775 RepID=A0A1Q3DC25_CEPFO|nr:Glyoxal_oxid_N domain-containing protein/DUF1929 domain-containing protein [Cephalotus follicularis]